MSDLKAELNNFIIKLEYAKLLYANLAREMKIDCTTNESTDVVCFDKVDTLLDNFKRLEIKTEKDCNNNAIKSSNKVVVEKTPKCNQNLLNIKVGGYLTKDDIEDDQYGIEDDEEEESTDSEEEEEYESDSDESFHLPVVLSAEDILPKRTFVQLKILPIYSPSVQVKEAFNEHFSKDALDKLNEHFCGFMEMNCFNMQHMFNMLLQIEDITNLAQYTALAQKNKTVRHNGSREYSIKLDNVPNLVDILAPHMDDIVLIPQLETYERAKIAAAPLKYPTDILIPHADEDATDIAIKRYIAQIVKVKNDCIYFKVRYGDRRAFSILHKMHLFDVIIRPLRFPIRYQFEALKLLASQPNVRQYLFPNTVPHRALSELDLKLVNTKIAKNPEQLQAVHNIVYGTSTNAPFIIFGPPGTGKTTTLVETILQLRLHKRDSRILVTAGSNSACDTLALRICKYFNSNPYVKMNLNGDHEIMRIFSKSIQQKGLKNIDQILLQHSNCRIAHYYPAVEDLHEYGIIVATLSTVGKLVTGYFGSNDIFTHIFIDEAGAATEPETLVGIMGIKSDKCSVILSGDHKQLGPVLKSECAAHLGLKKSMMERLLERPCYAVDDNGNYNHSLQARLRRNYRSHPEIVRLYNHLYYNNELIADARHADINLLSKWPLLGNSKFPIIFQAVHGITDRESNSPSTFNDLEIEVLMWYLHRLLVDGVNGRRKIRQSDIGIITPYKTQCRRIQQQLATHNWNGIETGSVEVFQGREKSIIIVSLVRSFANLGFIRSPNRLNVILSRAKSLLIIIGNPLTLQRNADYKFIIDECVKNGTVRRKKKTDKRQPPNGKWIKISKSSSLTGSLSASSIVTTAMEEEYDEEDIKVVNNNNNTETDNDNNIDNQSVKIELTDDNNNNTVSEEPNKEIEEAPQKKTFPECLPLEIRRELTTNAGNVFPKMKHQRYTKLELLKFNRFGNNFQECTENDETNSSDIIISLRNYLYEENEAISHIIELNENSSNRHKANKMLNITNANAECNNLLQHAAIPKMSTPFDNIVRCCVNCPENYLPVIFNAKSTLRYNKAALLNLR